jgi:hypothetical protein
MIQSHAHGVTAKNHILLVIDVVEKKSEFELSAFVMKGFLTCVAPIGQTVHHEELH